MSKAIDKYRTVMLRTNSKDYISCKVQSHDKKTGRILGKRIKGGTVGNPDPRGNEIVIAHEDDIISWLS